MHRPNSYCFKTQRPLFKNRAAGPACQMKWSWIQNWNKCTVSHNAEWEAEKEKKKPPCSSSSCLSGASKAGVQVSRSETPAYRKMTVHVTSQGKHIIGTGLSADSPIVVLCYSPTISQLSLLRICWAVKNYKMSHDRCVLCLCTWMKAYAQTLQAMTSVFALGLFKQISIERDIGKSEER